MKIYNKDKNLFLAKRVKLADGFFSRLIGLLNRSSIEIDEGLIIRPCRGVHTWFMKFSIDVIFLNKANKVVYLIQNMLPADRSPFIKDACQVIELSAGIIALTDTKIGDELIIEEMIR